MGNHLSSFLSEVTFGFGDFIQIVGLLISAALGVGIARFLSGKLNDKFSKPTKTPWLSFILAPAVLYGGFIVCWLLSFTVCSLWLGEVDILYLGLQGSFFVFVFLMLKQITQSYIIAFITTLMGLIPWLSHHLGQLNKLINSINKFAIQIGKVKLTPLTLAKALMLLVILGWCSSLIVDWANKQIKRNRKLKSNTKALISKSIEVSIYFLTFVIALSVLGIDLTALTVVGGALGVGIGFGLQKITSNFISGIILLLEKSIETDDLIEMENGIYGFIRHISARYTLIETFDGKEIMVPNEDFMTHRVTNWTFSNSKGRIEIPVGVSYKSDIKKAQALILEAANEHPLCIQDPKPECYLREYGDSSVNFLLFFFVDDVTQGRFLPQSEVMLAIWDKFKENDIEIPFPQRDIHIKSGDIK
jgi:small-conductance mechanosensitive channel